MEANLISIEDVVNLFLFLKQGLKSLTVWPVVQLSVVLSNWE